MSPLKGPGIKLTPWDDANRELAALVGPSNVKPCVPASRYNLVVIGAGTAGLVAAAGAAGLGAKVALVEKHLICSFQDTQEGVLSMSGGRSPGSTWTLPENAFSRSGASGDA